MIVDLEKQGLRQMFITETVSYIRMGDNGLWTVRFGATGRFFNYNPARLLYLRNPESIDLGERGLYIGKRHVTDVREALRFTDGEHTFYRVTHANGFCENLESSRVYITRTPLDETGGTTLAYLRKLADETGLLTEEGVNILARQYDLLDTKRDNVPLAQYLGGRATLATHRLPRHVYYPFGCNASQKRAVEAALTHQVSIIQGPPGTGKTQTILNIVANLVMAGRTVLVVSNNNSAVANVAEKLDAEGLGFLVAKLGSADNRKRFIESQPPYPDMTKWPLDDPATAKARVAEMLSAVRKGFEALAVKAKLTAELSSLTTEARHMGVLNAEDDWLLDKQSAKIVRLLNTCRMLAEGGGRIGRWQKFKWAIILGHRAFSLLGDASENLIPRLERAFYSVRAREIETGLSAAATTLKGVDMARRLKDLRTLSLWLFKDKVARTYSGERRKFELYELHARSEDVLREYPVVLSTTYSAKSCISPDMVFDYVIMDEASQVDIATGALALSCANNAVIVGDDKQLPNVVTSEDRMALDAVRSFCKVDDVYDSATHSFLQSCNAVFRSAPTTLLREHYRCHPKIIGFCNQRFYGGELIAMTTDDGDAKALRVVRTAKGNHARGHLNQREVDTIAREVMAECADSGSVGIITPYRVQAEAINAALGSDIASTVHKYQGRECDTIIMSMVDNEPTSFSDDPNLLNVAISRAKKRLCVVMTGADIPPDSNLGQLVAYVGYNNYEVASSGLRSVFDILYGQYSAERLAYMQTHKAVSDYLSENLVYDAIVAAITSIGLGNVGVLCHYPLSLLIADDSVLDEREKSFALSHLSHVDFLLFNKLTKMPLRAVEVDGWQFHKESEAQQERDSAKDAILQKIGLGLTRLSTTDTVTSETIIKLIKEAI